MKRIVLVALSLIIIAAFPAVVMASTITNADYVGTVRIVNSSTAATNQIVSCNISTNNLVNSNFISSNCSNTAILTSGAVDTAYMPSTDNTTPWMIFVPTIGASASLPYKLYTGGATSMDSKISYFPAAGGATVSDNASLECGSNYQIEVSGYVNTAVTGVNQYILRKGDGSGNYIIRLYVSAAGTITCDRYSFGVVWTASVSSVASGEHNIKLTCVSGTLTLNVDGSTASVESGSFIDVSGDWEWFGNGTMPYVYYWKITPSGTLKGYWYWQRGTAFYDISGNGHTATPTFRTTGTSANITAALVDFGPVSAAEASGGSTGSYATMVPGAIDPGGTFDELTPGNFPGSSFINDVMAGGGVPTALFWFPFGIIIVCIIGLLIAKFTSLIWLQVIIMCVIIGFFCVTIFPWWMVPIFGIFGATAVVIERPYL
jgi:hypothetical protein